MDPLVISLVSACTALVALIAGPMVTLFEIEPPTLREFRERIAKALTGWTWLVATENGPCAGYAYGTSHRERAAYRWSVETSAYVGPAFHRRGIGRALYLVLLDSLRTRGYCSAYAGIAQPNDARIALHRDVGFEPIGVFGRSAASSMRGMTCRGGNDAFGTTCSTTRRTRRRSESDRANLDRAQSA